MKNSTISLGSRQAVSNSAQHFSSPTPEKLSDKELYKKCQLYGAEARKWTRRFAALLPEVDRRQLYKKYGFYSIFEFAAKLAGMRHETVIEILRVAKKLEDKPLLLNQLEEQGINKLRLVANIATKENQAILAEKVETMSKATLATFIQEKFRAGTELEQNNTIMGDTQTGFSADFSGFIENNEPVQTKIPQRIAVTIPFEPNVELQLREFQKKLSRERKFPIELNEVIKILLEIAANVKPAAKMPKRSSTKQISAQKSDESVTVKSTCHLEPVEGCRDEPISVIASPAKRDKAIYPALQTYVSQFSKKYRFAHAQNRHHVIFLQKPNNSFTKNSTDVAHGRDA